MADQESEIDKIRGQLNSMELRLRRLESALAYSDARKTDQIQVNRLRTLNKLLFLMILQVKKRDWNHRSEDSALHGWAI